MNEEAMDGDLICIHQYQLTPLQFVVGAMRNQAHHHHHNYISSM